MKSLIPIEGVEGRIYLIRGRRVMVDSDLAGLYGVQTKALNLAVRRNIIRFPADFMFQLSDTEVKNLRFQIETSRWGGRRYTPYAFTEQGVAMLSSVLKSERAALVNIAIMRAFVKVREYLTLHKDLAAKFAELERKVVGHDDQIEGIFEAIRKIMSPPEPDRTLQRRIGFRHESPVSDDQKGASRAPTSGAKRGRR